MYTLNNNFEAETEEELLKNYVQYLFEHDKEVDIESIEYEREIIDHSFSRNYSQAELDDFEARAEDSLKLAWQEFNETQEEEQRLKDDYYNN